jgi:hypothetical protein
MLASFGSSIALPNSTLVLGYLVNEPKLLWGIYSHPPDEFRTFVFVSLSSNLLESFAAETRSEELVVDGGIVDGNEPIGLQKVE